MRDVIYLDAAASTPLAPEALAATIEALGDAANPGAAHGPGRAAAARVEEARESVAALVGVGPSAVTFVGSATEANNLAIRGLVRDVNRPEIVTTAVEHPSVLATVADALPDNSLRHVVQVTAEGEIDLDALAKALGPQTALVSVQAANNETGVLQPLDAVVELARSVGAFVHVDASQLMAWGATAVLDDCDLITVSSHKMHGPQGAAALIARRAAREQLHAVVTGGGQERGLRSGTANVAAIAGFGAAADLAASTGREAATSVRELRGRLLDGLTAAIGDVIEHGKDAHERLPGILNVAIGTAWDDSVESEALLARLPMIAASTGSACHAGAPGPSPVLLAMGISEWEASRSLRLSLNRYSTPRDVKDAVAELGRGYAELRRLIEPDTQERCAI